MVQRNHFRPRDFTCYVGISNPFALFSHSVTHSCYKMFRFNSSPVNRGNKGNTLFKRMLLQQTIPGLEKGRNLPPCYRPQPAQQICCLLRRGHFMTCIDLTDAYLSVNVQKSSQKYLCFQWRHRCYVFLGLPFGLNTAPRLFTKLLKPVAAYLRKRGIWIIV